MSEDWRSLPDRVLEQLSAYADSELAPAESRQLEKHLETRPAYREALQAFRQTKDMVAQIPQVRAPRSYALTEEMAGIQRGWTWFPSRPLATALAALMLVVLVGVDAFTSGAVGAGMVAETELRAQAPSAADQIEATAELQMLEEAEAEPAAGQEAEEPADGLQAAQGTMTPEGAVAGDFSAPTEADEESFRLGEEPQDRLSELESEPSRLEAFFAERPVLRSLEALLGVAFLLLVVSLFLRP